MTTSAPRPTPPRGIVRRAGLVGAVAVIALLSGCGGDRDGSPAAFEETPSPNRSPTASPTAAPDVPPASARGTARSSRNPSDRAYLVLTDVRTGTSDGYVRIVLEFSGPGRPGWVVGYVDEAVVDGAGTVVDLGGGAVLDVYASGTTWPAPGYYDGPRRLPSSDGDVLDGAYVAGTFEGTTQVLAGIDGDRAPFRVFTLTSPTRLVVDLRSVAG